MSEMVERVAQAICGDDNPANILTIHRIRARAAIAAMREPTEPMAQMASQWLNRPDAVAVAKTMWRASIDQALK